MSEANAVAELRGRVLSGDMLGAEHAALAGLQVHPQSIELRRALAGIYRQTQRDVQAESLLREVLVQDAGDIASAFTLAEILRDAGRMHGAAAVLRSCFEHAEYDANLAIRAIELLDDCRRQADAAAITERALAQYPHDARLHAYAGMLEVQTGDFARAREHYLYALAHDARACEWNAPHGLASAQRYAIAEHADFAIFRDCLARTDLSDKARTSLLFAAGKAYDDIGDYAQAARYFREGNALAHAQTLWSRKNWRRAMESRLAAKPLAQRLQPREWTPVFIVGMPRSGTTLVAELLARHPLVCNRGELPWLANLAMQPALAGNPPRAVLERTAALYAAQLLQDDAGAARWFIDKQPLNFRYVDLILALWPNAKIIHCRRSARDTALSLWSQAFVEDVQGYAYDFDDIALVMRDAERLLAHWRKFHAESIHELRYEQLTADSAGTMATLGAWLGLPATTASEARSSASISTASLWQARQPVYTRSVERWRNYAEFVPELLKFATE